MSPKKTRSSSGKSNTFLFLVISALFWLFKWIIIALVAIGKFIVRLVKSGIDKLSAWTQQRMADSGRDVSPRKVKTFVTGGTLIIVLGIVGVFGALSKNNTPIVPPAPTLTSTLAFTLTPSFTLTPTITATSTIIPPTATPLYGSAYETRCISKDSEVQTAIVTRVIDGDTIVVVMDGQEFHLRYIGIDSPEEGDPFHDQSKQTNEDLVLGKTVILVKDVSEDDSFDRLLRYVFVDQVFVNYALIHKGAAISGSWPPDTACDEVFQGAEMAAKSSKIGMWVASPTARPTAIILPTFTEVSRSGVIVPIDPEPTSPPVGNCDPSYPTVCIPPPPPDLDCKDISFRRFQVNSPDPHNFDGDGNGIGCESG